MFSLHIHIYVKEDSFSRVPDVITSFNKIKATRTDNDEESIAVLASAHQRASDHVNSPQDVSTIYASAPYTIRARLLVFTRQ
jgi:hypothetical protein